MSEHTDLPPATTPEGVNIHLGYIRRDLLDMKTQQAKDLQEIKESIGSLDVHFISEAQFAPIAKAVDDHSNILRELVSWKDNLTGRMVGIGIGIGFGSSSLVVFLVKLFGG